VHVSLLSWCCAALNSNFQIIHRGASDCSLSICRTRMWIRDPDLPSAVLVRNTRSYSLKVTTS
jgi:hypothetical protein